MPRVLGDLSKPRQLPVARVVVSSHTVSPHTGTLYNSFFCLPEESPLSFHIGFTCKYEVGYLEQETIDTT